jgi:hypothetical protein
MQREKMALELDILRVYIKILVDDALLWEMCSNSTRLTLALS